MVLAIMLLPLVTGSYALYETKHSPRTFKLSIAVLISAIMVEFCVFGLTPLLQLLGVAPFTDIVWQLGGTAVVIVLHLALTVRLMLRAEPDITGDL